MDIREAMLNLIESEDLVKKSGMTEVNRRIIKWKLTNNDPSLRHDTMRGWLTKAGFTEKADWRPPKKSPKVDTTGL